MKTLVTLAAVALATAPAFAQQRQTPNTPRTTGDRPTTLQTDTGDAHGRADTGGRMSAAGQTEQGRLDDAALVRWLAQDNHKEVALARYAKGKSQSSRVQQFAEHMIQDHQKFATQLKQSFDGTEQGRQSEMRRQGGTAAVSPRSGTGRGSAATGDVGRADRDRATVRNQSRNPGQSDAVRDTNRTGDKQPQADRQARNERMNRGEGRMDRERVGAGQAGNMEVVLVPVEYEFVTIEGFAPQGMSNSTATANELLQFRQELGEQCLQSLKSNFDKLSPADFDKMYATQQIGAHLAMLDSLKLAERKVSPELKSVLQEGQQVTQEHLKLAIDLLNQVTDAE